MKAIGISNRYEWTLNDVVLSAQTEGILVSESGIYKVRSVNAEGCRSSGVASLTFQLCSNPGYQEPVQTTFEICNGTPFSIDLSATNVTSVVWSHNEVADVLQTTSVLNFSTFTSASAGEWISTLSNDCGTTVTRKITLVLNETSQPAIIASGPLSFCKGETVTLSAPDGFRSYQWSTGETSRELTVSDTGEYSVRVNNGCESPVSEMIRVVVNELPNAPTGIEIKPQNVLRAVGSGERYEWKINDVLSPVETAEIEMIESGTYTVRSISDQGCYSEGSVSGLFTITGIESQDTGIVLFPNPVKGILNIDVDNNMQGRGEVMVFGASGNQVLTQSVNFNEPCSVNLENLSAGLYKVMIRNGKKTELKTIVVK